MTYQMITTERALEDLLDEIGHGTAALDFETTGLDPASCEVRLAQICNDDVWAVVDFWALPGKAFSAYAEWFEDATWVAFNAGFEWQWFEHEDAPHVRVIDVAHARRALMGGDQMGLAQMLKTDLGHAMPKDQQVSNWGAPELSEAQLQYAADDALWTWKLWQHWQAKLDEKPSARAAQAMLDDLVPVVHEMKQTGLLLDRERHRKLVAHWREREALFTARIREHVPEEDVANIGSRAQWSDFFGALLPDEVLSKWPRTEKSGQLAITNSDCRKMATVVGGEGPLAETLFAIADLFSIRQYLSNFGDKLINMATQAADGRIHPSYNIARAVTGRFSSSAPNAQQLPRDRELLGEETSVRRSFLAPDGKLLVSLDYSGIELKVLALLSGDEQLLHDCIEGDLHSEVASYMVGHRIDKKTPEGKEARSKAKGVSFGIIYGSGALGLSGTLRTSMDRAQDLIDFWADRYPKAFGLRHEKMDETVANGGFMSVADGGYIYLGKKPDLPKCANYPVQRAALTVMARALIRHKDRLDNAAQHGRHLGTRMAATIHDAIIDEARVDDAPEALRWMKDDMVAGYLDVFPDAPTAKLVEGGVGPSWGELEDQEV
jgi:DNA polymerase-1